MNAVNDFTYVCVYIHTNVLISPLYSDIDECSSELGGDLCTAESNTVCSNTLGNYTCTCQDGYSRDNAGICRKR